MNQLKHNPQPQLKSNASALARSIGNQVLAEQLGQPTGVSISPRFAMPRVQRSRTIPHLSL